MKSNDFGHHLDIPPPVKPVHPQKMMKNSKLCSLQYFFYNNFLL